MSISADDIKALRDKTGVSIMQCKKALEETNGDAEKALVVLQKKSSEIAAKKSGRSLGAGVVQSYIHAGGTVGAMVLLSCETDFVAKNEEFKQLAYDIAMHVAATGPEFLKEEDITDEDKDRVKEVLAEEVGDDKDPAMREKILEGKLSAYFKERVLMRQSFVKDPDVTISDLVERATQKFGERTEITEYARISV